MLSLWLAYYLRTHPSDNEHKFYFKRLTLYVYLFLISCTIINLDSLPCIKHIFEIWTPYHASNIYLLQNFSFFFHFLKFMSLCKIIALFIYAASNLSCLAFVASILHQISCYLWWHKSNLQNTSLLSCSYYSYIASKTSSFKLASQVR